MMHLPFYYGIHVVEELVKTRSEEIDHVFIASDRKSERLFDLLKLCRKKRLSYSLVPAEKITRICGTAKHQGAAARCGVKPYCDIESLLEMFQARRCPPLFVVPASVEDPRNLGAIIRSCAAFHADGVLVERKHGAPLSSVVAKAAAGALETMPVARPRNLEGWINNWKQEGFSVFGCEVEASTPPGKLDYSGKTILIVGGEHRGIPPYLSRLCTARTGIPMTHQVNSLNTSVAASIVLYESWLQRRTLMDSG